MSRKRNQGSQTPQLNATAEEGEERTQIELEEEQEHERDGNVASTTSSTSKQEEDEEEETESEPRDMPLILLSTPQPRNSKDASSNTDPRRPTPTTVASETSEDDPSPPLPDRPITISGQNVTFSRRETSRHITTSSDQYDKDEPLTTKTQKIYKKRPPIVNPVADDSDESLAIQRNNPMSRPASFEMVGSIIETDFPLSDETDRMKASSQTVSSSGSFFAREADFGDPTPNDSNLHPHLGLASGLGFIYMAIPPDGGYGWVVLILSFLAQLIVDGIVFTVGILLPSIGAEFNANSGQVVLVGSIQIGCYFLGGAFSSALINSYGFRPVALLGVLFSAVSLVIASFSPNLAVLIVFYSVIGGPGLSMIWVSSQLIIGYYFERYRPIASGFSCSGAGAGICIFSITNTYLVQHIGWRNTIRVQVVLICLLFFVAMAYLEVAPSPVGVMHTDHVSSSSSNEYYGYFHVHNFLGDDASSKRSRHVLDTYEPPKKRRGKFQRFVHFCCPCCGRRRSKNEATPSERSERNYVVRPDPIQREDLFYTGPADYEEPHNREQFDGKELELVGTQTHLQRAAYGLHNIKDYDNNNESLEPGARSSELDSKRPTPTSPQAANRRKKPNKGKKRHWLHNKIIRAFNRLFDVHLLKIFEFRILLASAFLYPMGFNIPFVYSKMRTTIPVEYAQMIAPAIGASNFLIRNLCGFIAYKLRDWTNYICGGGIVFGGFMVFISAFYGHDLIWFQFMYGLFYGIAPAVFATLRALIYVRYLGLSKLTNAFGITALAMGLGVFIGTTLGGVMVDNTGGYVVPFAFAGICIMVSGALKLILPALIKCRENRKKY